MANVQLAVAGDDNTQVILSVPGVQGPAGSNLPPSGTTNQVLYKQSNTDYDTAWSFVTSAMIASGTIVNEDVNASAAIAGTKISPNFGSQNVVTTGTSTAASFIPTSSSVPTNGVYLPSANNVAISTNGTGRLFVDADGNVILGASSLLSGASGRVLQIGNTSDAASTLQFAATTTGSSYIQFGDSGSPGSYAGYLQYGHTDNFLAIGTNSTEKLRIDSSGRLGLGTSSPSYRLHAVQASEQTDPESNAGAYWLFQNSSTTLNTCSALALGTNSDLGTAIVAQRVGANNEHVLKFQARNSSGSLGTRMTLTGSGSLGIGTTEPSNSLEVAFSAANSISGITITNGQWFGYGARLQFRNLLTSAGTVGETASIYGEGDGSNAGRLVFHTTAGGTASERARIDSSGRLLVGTSSGTNVSTITCQGNSGAAGTEAFLRLNRGTATPADGSTLGAIIFGDSAESDGAYVYAQRDGGTWSASSKPTRLVFSTTADGAGSPTERMRITQDGSVIQNYYVYDSYNAANFITGAGSYIGSINAPGLGLAYRGGDNANAGVISFGGLSSNGNAKTLAAIIVTQDNTATNRANGYLRFYTNRDSAADASATPIERVRFTDRIFCDVTTITSLTSERRLKQDIDSAPLDPELCWNVSRDLPIRSFAYKNNPESTNYGYIVDEVLTVDSSLVFETGEEDDEGPIRSYDNAKLQAMYHMALKQALAKIETLEAKVAALEGV